jgi:hypothetical protein
MPHGQKKVRALRIRIEHPETEAQRVPASHLPLIGEVRLQRECRLAFALDHFPSDADSVVVRGHKRLVEKQRVVADVHVPIDVDVCTRDRGLSAVFEELGWAHAGDT